LFGVRVLINERKEHHVITRRFTLSAIGAATALPLLARRGVAQTAMSRATAFAFSFTTLDGNKLRLAEQTGRPVLVVNTASLCGYTPQYAGLETLWTRYRDRGLLVIGVPSNDFGGQEPGGASEIHRTAHRHGVTFPLTEKVSIRGPAAHPFYRWAATQRPDETPRWNFHKYLVGQDGTLAAAFGSAIEPTDQRLTAAIERQLPPA
jgi:glutathione peroxidase